MIVVMAKEWFVPIIRALNAAGVDYVVVGGLAVNLLGHPRATIDLDLIVDFEPENIESLRKVLRGGGYRPRMPVDEAGLADESTRKSWQARNMVVYAFVRTQGPPNLVDVFIDHPIEYSQLRARSIESEYCGEMVRHCSLDDLLHLKQIASRPQDLNDIRNLKDAHGRSGT